MIVKLKRTGIFILGLAIIYSYFIINRVRILVESDVTTGVIVSAGRSSVAQFNNNDFGTLYAHNNNRDLHEGDTVAVLYNRQAPNIAYVYNTYSFWVSYLLYSLILVIPWSAFAWGYVSPYKVVEIRLWGKEKES
jgi:hypothetical protein